jgi:hypothetical protein
MRIVTLAAFAAVTGLALAGCAKEAGKTDATAEASDAGDHAEAAAKEAGAAVVDAAQATAAAANDAAAEIKEGADDATVDNPTDTGETQPAQK